MRYKEIFWMLWLVAFFGFLVTNHYKTHIEVDEYYYNQGVENAQFFKKLEALNKEVEERDTDLARAWESGGHLFYGEN